MDDSRNLVAGDERGFVGTAVDETGRRVLENRPGTPYLRDLPELERAMRARMHGECVFLQYSQAAMLLKQFHETANHRHWQLLAVAIMRAHIHLLTGVPGDPDPATILRDFKSYGSRALNRQWSRPSSGTWWTRSGSRRKKANYRAIRAAVQYIAKQERPLCTWIAPQWREELGI